jgi:hypothetical protein
MNLGIIMKLLRRNKRRIYHRILFENRHPAKCRSCGNVFLTHGKNQKDCDDCRAVISLAVLTSIKANRSQREIQNEIIRKSNLKIWVSPEYMIQDRERPYIVGSVEAAEGMKG